MQGLCQLSDAVASEFRVGSLPSIQAMIIVFIKIQATILRTVPGLWKTGHSRLQAHSDKI